jgi:DNA-binding transcriptional LysR family regulator
MTPSVASHWLVPRLARIRQRHPEVDVQLIADRRLLDLRAEGIDIAVRFCGTPSASYHATRLMTDRVIPVCAPYLLHRHGPVASVDALLSLPLLHDSATAGDGSRSDGQSWREYWGKPNVVCRAGQGIVTLTLDGRIGAEDGAPARIVSRVVYTSRCARHQMPQTGSPDMRRLPGDVGVDESGHG